MHDRLCAHQDDLSFHTLIDLAQEISLDLERIIDDLQEGVHRAHVDLDVESASGVHGTPTFFIGEHRHHGPWDAVMLGDALDAAR